MTPPLRQSSAFALASSETEPVTVLQPRVQTAPLVFASPHSGRDYPEAFLAASPLAIGRLRRSEDAFIDEIFAAAPRLGAPLVVANFPRAYIDPNRESFELDPTMFSDSLPRYVNRRSVRVGAGLGTIARVVATGEEIYARKLRFADALERIERYYRPYHHALESQIASTRQRFGVCLLIDCHSMPSVGRPTDADTGTSRVDIVLGDAHGSACGGHIVDAIAGMLIELDFKVRYNDPYAGGFTTRHYGRPDEGVHTLQIEINRALYMDEIAITRAPAMAGLVAKIERAILAIVGLDAKFLGVS